MTTKHTPGPWHSVPSVPSEGFDCWWLMAGSRNIATISGYQGDTECEANARLIAAAPDLLEALKHARQNMPHPDQMIDDAIAKAEGRDND